MSQCASSGSHNESSLENKLFDISSSSSSDSDDSDSESECSEIAALDTDDEEFVNLLEKYYEYIDLESDYSDITEVSPMSSLTASPLPPFNSAAGRPNDIPPEYQNVPSTELERPFELPMSRMPRFSKQCSGETKPLPPLIIHTLEDISVQSVSNSQLTAAIGQQSLKSLERDSSSLLMRVERTESDQFDMAPPNTKATSQKSSDNGLDFRCGSYDENKTSSSFTPARLSPRSVPVSNNTASTTEGSVGASNSKKQVKNHTFSSEQMRRIDTENSILFRKILESSKTHHGPAHGRHWSHGKGITHLHRSSHSQHHKSSSAILRQRQQKRIDHENSVGLQL
jgi:hypothetical protein